MLTKEDIERKITIAKSAVKQLQAEQDESKFPESVQWDLHHAWAALHRIELALVPKDG
jgi:hypothetical protein